MTSSICSWCLLCGTNWAQSELLHQFVALLALSICGSSLLIRGWRSYVKLEHDIIRFTSPICVARLYRFIVDVYSMGPIEHDPNYFTDSLLYLFHRFVVRLASIWTYLHVFNIINSFKYKTQLTKPLFNFYFLRSNSVISIF